jgi:hypothetical protein
MTDNERARRGLLCVCVVGGAHLWAATQGLPAAPRMSQGPSAAAVAAAPTSNNRAIGIVSISSRRAAQRSGSSSAAAAASLAAAPSAQASVYRSGGGGRAARARKFITRARARGPTTTRAACADEF